MSPLLLVGMFTLLATNPANCDVKHVLEGSAHPPQVQHADPRAINHLASSLNSVSYSSSEEASSPFDTKEGGSSSEGHSGEFWWMKNDSPLKQAHEYYKKCSLKGNCITPVSSINELSQSSEKTKLDLSSNPFLNGGVKTNSNTHNNGQTIDISNNPFFNGQINAGALHSGNGETIKKGSGFIGVQPAEPFGHGKSTGCAQAGYACVSKDLCTDGVVENLASIRTGVSYSILL